MSVATLENHWFNSRVMEEAGKVCYTGLDQLLTSSFYYSTLLVLNGTPNVFGVYLRKF
jgi:hypothetical protein